MKNLDFWTKFGPICPKKSGSAQKSENPNQSGGTAIIQGKNLQKRAQLSRKCQNQVYIQKNLENYQEFTFIWEPMDAHYLYYKP